MAHCKRRPGDRRDPGIGSAARRATERAARPGRRAARRPRAGPATRSDDRVRAAVEFVGPVPVEEVSVERAGRACGAQRGPGRGDPDRPRATLPAGAGLAGAVRRTRPRSPHRAQPAAVPTGLPDLGGDFPYHDTIDWQAVRGSMRTVGPGLVWARPQVLAGGRRAVERACSGWPWSATRRAASPPMLDWDEWSFVNIDLDVHLSRPVDGELGADRRGHDGRARPGRRSPGRRSRTCGARSV